MAEGGGVAAPGVHLDWILYGLDVAGVAVFAASGALAASRKQMDIVGFVLIAAVTGIGGGTIRDLLLGITPVFWVRAPSYVLLCAGVAVLLFIVAPSFESRFRALLWADAAGMAVFCVIGAERALDTGAPVVVAVLMGMITATFGGLVRDVLCAEIPLVLRREIYVTAAAAGAAVYVALFSLGVGRPLTALAAFLAAFVIRGLGIVFGLSLPSYRSRPGRDYPDRRGQ
jgi:uncharacterized membrane protein YeiH